VLFLLVTSLLPGLLFVLQSQAGVGESKPRNVTLYISVYDQQGKPVEEFHANDLEVLEDRKAQAISSLRYEKGSPVSLGVLIDIGKKMSGERINFALDWLKSFAGKLKSPDEFFVNGFSDDSQELVDFISPEDYLEEPLDHLSTGGQSATGLALDLAMIKLRQGRNAKKGVIFLSAGMDVAGPATLDHVAKFGYPIHSLAVEIAGGDGIKGSLDWLKNLSIRGPAIKVYADQSGGSILPLTSSLEGQEAITKVISELKNQYRLEFTSSSSKKAGQFVKLEIKAKRPDYQVHYLKRYQVPRQ
jgi:VWFA-related protein